MRRLLARSRVAAPRNHTASNCSSPKTDRACITAQSGTSTHGLVDHGVGTIDSYRQPVADSLYEVAEICTGSTPEIQNSLTRSGAEKSRLPCRGPRPLPRHPLNRPRRPPRTDQTSSKAPTCTCATSETVRPGAVAEPAHRTVTLSLDHDCRQMPVAAHPRIVCVGRSSQRRRTPPKVAPTLRVQPGSLRLP